MERNNPIMAASGKDALRGAFLEAMSHTAATVSVVTTDGPAGRAGVTVSAMTSVSADTQAPSLLVCVHREGGACLPILKNGVFCVNVLTDSQARISDVFAGRVAAADGDRFSAADWTTMRTGAPRMADPLVAFDCRLTHSELIGTHFVMFGQVEDIFIANRGLPLIYASRAYVTAVELAQGNSGRRECLRISRR